MFLSGRWMHEEIRYSKSYMNHEGRKAHRDAFFVCMGHILNHYIAGNSFAFGKESQ